MEWAAAQGADVVNMSLGAAFPSNGTAPMDQAVNALTRGSGTLFVVAAGNSGPSGSSVGSPGSADEALTVGAVDSADQIAEFSSRGPRIGDFAVKPDVTAPGVDIVAPLAAGAALGNDGQVVDGRYLKLSGTSRATPHVAGAAAPPASARVKPLARRKVWCGEGWRSVPIYDRALLPAGTRIIGPAVIVELHGTTIVEPGWRAEVHTSGTLVLTRAGRRGLCGQLRVRVFQR